MFVEINGWNTDSSRGEIEQRDKPIAGRPIRCHDDSSAVGRGTNLTVDKMKKMKRRIDEKVTV